MSRRRRKGRRQRKRDAVNANRRAEQRREDAGGSRPQGAEGTLREAGSDTVGKVGGGSNSSGAGGGNGSSGGGGGKTANVVTLDPLAPVIVRSGRPFGSHYGADPARIPPPSTIAGCLRTAWARLSGTPFSASLAKLPVKGPLLLSDDGSILVPKPADALYLAPVGADPDCHRTSPQPFGNDCDADQPDGLLPVRLTEDIAGKPRRGPAFWTLDHLLDFRREEDAPIDYRALEDKGWSPTSSDRRTHVEIDSQTGAAADGKLFQTEGLVLDASIPMPPWHTAQSANHAKSHPGVRFVAWCGKPMRETLVHLGGERRMAQLEPAPHGKWPSPPDDWCQSILDSNGLTLTLLTPAIFAKGYRPGWLIAHNGALEGTPPATPLVLRLRAAAVPRWEPHSGWDLVARGPRATRKLAVAGATYWFSIEQKPQLAGDALAAIESLWLSNISDSDQDRADGFGLALPGPWSPPSAQRGSP